MHSGMFFLLITVFVSWKRVPFKTFNKKRMFGICRNTFCETWWTQKHWGFCTCIGVQVIELKQTCWGFIASVRCVKTSSLCFDFTAAWNDQDHPLSTTWPIQRSFHKAIPKRYRNQSSKKSISDSDVVSSLLIFPARQDSLFSWVF